MASPWAVSLHSLDPSTWAVMLGHLAPGCRQVKASTQEWNRPPCNKARSAERGGGQWSRMKRWSKNQRKGGTSSRLRSWRQNRIQAKACLRGAVMQGFLGRWAKWPWWGLSSQSLHSITTRGGIKGNTIFSLPLLPPQLRGGVGVYHVCFYGLDHNCAETLACIKIITSKIKNVDFWAPLPPSAPIATISRNPDAGIITLKIMANNDGAHVNVQCRSVSYYFRNSASPRVSETSTSTFSVPKFSQHFALAAWTGLSRQQQYLFCAV